MGKDDLISDLEECRRLRRKSIINQVNTVIKDLKNDNYDLETEEGDE